MHLKRSKVQITEQNTRKILLRITYIRSFVMITSNVNKQIKIKRSSNPLKVKALAQSKK